LFGPNFEYSIFPNGFRTRGQNARQIWGGGCEVVIEFCVGFSGKRKKIANLIGLIGIVHVPERGVDIVECSCAH
jgi:hypothetical protein